MPVILHPPKGAILLTFFYWLTRKRVNVLFDTHLVICIVLLWLMVLLLADFVFPCSRNTLWIRNDGSHIYISCSHIFHPQHPSTVSPHSFLLGYA